MAKVNKEDYSHYTKNESENERVIKLQKFINALEDVGDFTKVYPANIQQGLNNVVHYDISQSKYVINNTVFS